MSAIIINMIEYFIRDHRIVDRVRYNEFCEKLPHILRGRVTKPGSINGKSDGVAPRAWHHDPSVIEIRTLGHPLRFS